MIATFLLPLVLATQPQALPVHAMQAREHASSVSVLERKTFFLRDGDIAQPATERFARTIYGYYPYWADHDENIPWEHLTHLAFFSVTLNPDGSLGDDHNWGSRGAALVEAGRSHGVKVVLTVTMFDSDEIREVLSTAQNRDRAIDNLLQHVQDAGGQGINIDFEFVPAAQDGESPSPKQNFVTFMTDLTTAFHAAIENSHVSLATPAIDWGGTYDYDALALSSDGLMIMGYGYHWSGGNPGPLSPIVGGGIWGQYSLTWTIEDYFNYGGEENRSRFILGLPLYGRNWPSTDLTLPGTATAAGPALSLASCDQAFLAGKLWDETTSTPYKLFMDGDVPTQLFCEDIESMRAKFELIESYNLGGVMFWDVGKVSGNHAVWSEVSTAYAAEPGPGDCSDMADAQDPADTADPEPTNDDDQPSDPAESDPSDTSVADPAANGDSDASDPSDSEDGGCQAVQGESLWTVLMLLSLLVMRRRIQSAQLYPAQS
jgi:spore germination protein YaaH